MADQMLPLGLKAIPIATNHYHKVWDPAQYQYKKARGQIPKDDPEIRSVQVMEEKGYVLRKRSEVQSDEEIVEVVRHRGQRLPRRPGMPRQTSSMNDMRNQQMVPYRNGGRRNDQQMTRYRGADISDSEGSPPPRSRRGKGAKSTNGKSQNGRGKSSSSSESSSDLGSSTSDEKKCKRLARKKWITAGLAGVATIHAAAKVYSSIESHDKRIEEVKAGKISPEENHKKQRAAHWQDAGAIAIAALGIKGAMSEWNETMEQQHEHRELLEHREEMHKKRLEHERRRKAREQGGYYKGRDGQWYYDHQEPQGSVRGKSRDHSQGQSRGQSQGQSRGPTRRSTAPVDSQEDY